MPGISLIVPCYNHATTLERAVASGLAQSALEEIIIVDDHSTDDSLNVARALEEGDPRVRILQTERNMGPGGARNLGVREARGKYVSFLDADDELLGDFFREALEIMDAQPEMRVVKPEEEFFDPVKGYILPEFDPRHQAAVLSSIHGLIMRRETFLRLGGFPEDPAFRGPCGGEDVAFMQAVMEHFQPIGRIGCPSYRVWSQTGTHTDRFLANTRLKGESFEFVQLHPDQEPGGPLTQALGRYLAKVNAQMDVRRPHTTK